MGDCRIRIVVSGSLLDNSDASTEQIIEKGFRSFVGIHSADTTVREIAEGNPALKELVKGKKVTLWDCTLHPPKDITSWPFHDFPDLTGPKSKTLHSSGWFPSGTLVVLPKGERPSEALRSESTAYVDLQYNTIANHSADKGDKVKFSDPSLVHTLPSQVIKSVTNRFASEDQNELERMEEVKRNHGSIQGLRKRNLQDRLASETERSRKLEERIAKLEGKSEENKVSDQVLRMLVKSRATGDKGLKQQDRLYCRCIVLVDTKDSTQAVSKEYRYFSSQDSFGKVAKSFSKPSQTCQMWNEVLCKQPLLEEGSPLLHRRYPFAMRIYEALSKGYLSVSNTNYLEEVLIVRWYKDQDDATPVVVLETNPNPTIDVQKDNNPEIVKSTKQAEPPTSSNDDSNVFEDISLSKAIERLENPGGKKKKSSKAARKVREMKLKSKAKGTKTIRPEDRVYLEIFVETAADAFPCIFLSRKDPLERVLALSAVSSVDPRDWEFLVPIDTTQYRRIPQPSLSMDQASEKGLLNSFDRLVLRRKHT